MTPTTTLYSLISPKHHYLLDDFLARRKKSQERINKKITTVGSDKFAKNLFPAFN